MKLVAFGDSITYPSKDGISAHTIGNLLALSKSSEFNITLVVCTRGEHLLPNMPFSIVNLPPDKYYNSAVISELLDTLSPDILQTYSSYYARLALFDYASEKKIPTIVEHHDVDTEHMAVYGKDGVNKWQQQALQRASLNRTLSDTDAVRLKNLAPESVEKIVNIPTILADTPNKVSALPSGSNEGVLFVGNCSYPPNRAAAQFIIDQIAPHMPHVPFFIIGRNSETLKTSTRNVRVLGFVDDISNIAQKCRVGIAPLANGSGLKIKVLTYLNQGLPVVGTPISFAGFRKSKYLHRTTLENFLPALRDAYASHSIINRNDVLSYYDKTYASEGSIKQLHDLYFSITFNELLTPDNVQPVSLDASYIPMLNEKR